MDEKSFKLVATENCIMDGKPDGEGRPSRLHYVVVYMRGLMTEETLQEPVNAEPNKCDGWHWYVLN